DLFQSVTVACADKQCARRAMPAPPSEELPAPAWPGLLSYMRGDLAQGLALLIRKSQVAPVGGRHDAVGRPVDARAGPCPGVGRVLFPARQQQIPESHGEAPCVASR